MLASVFDFLPEMSWQKLLLGGGLFVLMFMISLAEVAFILVKLPPTYLLHHRSTAWWADKPRAVRWLGIIAKNLLGLLHVVIGILLSMPGIPGQGILTILIGVMLMDIPGLDRLERKIVGRPRVLAAINRLRARYGRPPLELDDHQAAETRSSAPKDELAGDSVREQG